MDNIHEMKLWDSLAEKSKNIENNFDKLLKKRTGTYYTNLQLTDAMMDELVQYCIRQDNKKNIVEYRFLEPCVGSGNFVFSYIKAVIRTGISIYEANVLLHNIYVADINKDALNEYKDSLRKIALFYWNITLTDEYFDDHIGGGLLIDVTAQVLEYISIDCVFPPSVIQDGFDIVVTNPPYKNLKAEKNQYSNKEEYEHDQDKYSKISHIVAKKFLYSTNGVLNLYKLFVEEIINRYAKKESYISLLIPAQIMSDKTCMNLRTYLLRNTSINSIWVINENNSFIDAHQSLCAIMLEKGKVTESIKLKPNYCLKPNDITEIFIEDIFNNITGNSIFAISEKEYSILKKLRNFPVIKELNFITNLRGELDLTINKKNIVTTNTKYKLIRGRDIGYYALNGITNGEFVAPEFIDVTKKKMYIKHSRIACQQIANMNKKRRVTFSYIPPNYVLGNSCNFISVTENIYGIDIYALLGLLNTNIINWLFKLTSSNNHINNYEIDSFPIPVEAPELSSISKLVREYLNTGNKSIIKKIEILAESAYTISSMEKNNDIHQRNYIDEYVLALHNIIPFITKTIAEEILQNKVNIEQYCIGLDKFDLNVVKGITNKYAALYNGYLLNHTTFKLSDLDLEMIKAVPQGGNWKNIPIETIEKSKRLKRITETGGRTTLYGRIDYSKPSYTITTYFNRPGNGTYVHPIHERVLSVREAARFQTFKDDYYFWGNKTQLLKQVGNAVPTLLAYQIGKKIKDITGCSKSIDLFCGAGGMTAGFKAAGISSLISNDIEESACITLKINNPDITVLCGDITQEEIKKKIELVSKDTGVDIICGGPPCQGFSMAGFRAVDDPRNQLFREFVDIVKRVNPKVIVFENVEGLLSYQGGKTYKEVHTLFSELGYNTEGRTLLASDYAIPQKRKRVIIICTQKKLGIEPGRLFPEPITEKISQQITAWDTISDLENIECSEVAQYERTTEFTAIMQFFKGHLSYNEYVFSMTPIKYNHVDVEKKSCCKHIQLNLFEI